MIELTYKSPFHPDVVTYSITSQVNIVPDIYPFPSWNPPNPPRRLVVQWSSLFTASTVLSYKTLQGGELELMEQKEVKENKAD